MIGTVDPVSDYRFVALLGIVVVGALAGLSLARFLLWVMTL